MRAETRSEYHLRVQVAVEFVLSRLDNPPSAIEVADQTGFSRFHFGRIFSLAVGESIAEFVRRIRLERAAWQLENRTTSVTEIAFEAGFGSLEGFSRAFRDTYHGAPSEFRLQPSRYEVQSLCEVHWCPNGSRSKLRLVLDPEINMEARVETLEEIVVVALRHIGPYHHIGQSFGQLAGWVQSSGIPMGRGIAIYHDNPDEVAGQNLRSDACIEVAPDFALPDTNGLDIRIEKISAGTYGVMTHKGSYEGLGDAWARFMGNALPQLGRALDATPPFEIYLNDCMVTPVEELRTDLYAKLC